MLGATSGSRHLRTQIFVLAVCLLVANLATAAVQVLRLDGSLSRVVVEHSNELNPQTGLTLEAWVRLDATTGCQTVIGKGIDSGYWLAVCNGVVTSAIAGVGDTIGAGTDGEISANEWAHVAMTYDGAQRIHYVNGEVVWQQSILSDLPDNTRSLGIGGDGSSATFPGGLFELDGRISEVRIWSYARPIEALRRSLYQMMTEMEPRLIAVFPLEGSPDERFQRHAAILSGTATFSSLSSPPTPYDPFRIRPTSPSPVIDGLCNEGTYQNRERDPSWKRS
ncbi:MAG: LamG domain-containing protein, partial [Pseudomonadota bacterium]